MNEVVEVWESYGYRNELTCWKTEELAKSHGMYFIDIVARAEVLLSPEEIEDLNNELPVFD